MTSLLTPQVVLQLTVKLSLFPNTSKNLRPLTAGLLHVKLNPTIHSCVGICSHHQLSTRWHNLIVSTRVKYSRIVIKICSLNPRTDASWSSRLMKVLVHADPYWCHVTSQAFTLMEKQLVMLSLVEMIISLGIGIFSSQVWVTILTHQMMLNARFKLKSIITPS